MEKMCEKGFISYKVFMDFKPVNDDIVLEMFGNYMRRMAIIKEKSTSESTINCYCSTIKRYAKNNNMSVVELYNVIHKHIDNYFSNRGNYEKNEKGHGREISSLKKFGEFKNYIENAYQCRDRYKSVETVFNVTEKETENIIIESQPSFISVVNNNPFYNYHSFLSQKQRTVIDDNGFLSEIQKTAIEDSLDSDKGDKFFKILTNFIKAKGLEEVDCYKKASVSKQVFSNLRKGVIPKKKTVLFLALALELDLDDAENLLKSAGYTFSSNIMDRVIFACIKTKVFDVPIVRELMSDLGVKDA